jgi:hypothetical protein
MAVSSGITPALIHQARVLDVDIASYSVTVATEFSQKPLSNISFAVPYLHPYNGEGIYFMPEVGSLCWLAEPSDGNMPFILAWSAAQNEGDFRAHRHDLNPGDIYLGTRDENFMILRRGGVLQIGATGLCQRIFLPINNTIRDMCENYELHSLGGDLTWNIARTEKTDTGKQQALLKLYAREFANDPKAIAELEIGSHGDKDKTILSLIVKDSGASGGAAKVTLKMDKEGTVTWDIKKNLSYKVEGDYSLAVTGEIAITGKKSMTTKTTEKFKVEADGNIDMKTKATAYLEASSGIKLVSKTDVGNALYGVVIMTPALSAFLSGHTHNVTAVSAPSGPPIVAAPSCTSSKLKAE